MIVGLMPARNEAWCIAYSARAALAWCDHLVILDHASTDATPAIMRQIDREFPDRVTLLSEPDPEWREMRQRQRMLEAARDLGARWIAIVDADEILTANFHAAVRQAAELLPSGFGIVTPLLNCWRSLDCYRNDAASLYGSSWTNLLFRDGPEVRWQAREDGYEFHRRPPSGVHGFMRVPGLPNDGSMALAGAQGIELRSLGGVLHLQHASWRRMKAKQALYQLTEALRWPHLGHDVIRKRYAAALEERGAVLTAVPESWWPAGLDRDMIDLDAEPWQEGEIRSLLTEHGREAFEGLNLFEDAR